MPAPKSNPEVLSFLCINCKTKLKVKIALAGRYIECPKCKKRIPVPSSQKEADDEVKDYDVKNLAYDVPKRCTKCNARMPKGSVLCVKCGFDYQKGRQLVAEDHTLKEGELTRGGPALRFMIGEIIFAIVGVIWLVYRGRESLWYEFGAIVGFICYLIPAIVFHAIQWNNYHELPIRDSPSRQEEDRAERVEARDPLGDQTFVWFLGLIGAGVGLAYFGHPWLFEEKPTPPPVAAVPIPAPAPQVPVPQPTGEAFHPPQEVDTTSQAYINNTFGAEAFTKPIETLSFAIAYSKTAEIFRSKLSEQQFTEICQKVLENQAHKTVYFNFIAIQPPDLTNPDFIYDTSLPPEERAVRILGEGGATSQEIPVETRSAWISAEMARVTPTNDAPPTLRLIVLLQKTGDKAEVVYFQFRRM